jgi:GTP-binding protein
MFTDECTVFVEAGRGGNGSASLHSEPYKPRGGPDGGNGGRGGSVIFEVARGMHDLSWLAEHPHQRARPGGSGRSDRRDGPSAKDLVIQVPDGTIVFDDDGPVADLVGDGARVVVAHGGRGGRGNAQLANARNRVPRVAESGEAGEAKRVRVELRTVADIGLVGLPNAGKSTLLSRLTAATPKIADYPFTTLTPNLGVAETGDGRAVIADVPGLIEGAHEGKGLGHRFLRHIVRCRALVLVVDLASADPSSDLAVLRTELGSYDQTLITRPSIVVGTKADLVDDPATAATALQPDALAVSALTGAGVEEFRARVDALASEAAASEPERTTHVVLRPGRPRFAVKRDERGTWHVEGRSVERWVLEADLDDEDELAKLQRNLRREGVFRVLEASGVAEGDDVEIRGLVFAFVRDADGGSDGAR